MTCGSKSRQRSVINLQREIEGMDLLLMADDR